MFHLFTIFAYISILCYIEGTSTNSNSIERTIQIARNQCLRMYLWKKTKITTASIKSATLRKRFIETKEKIKDRTTKIYDAILLKYYDSQMTYYSLPPDTRELIEQIINLHF